MFFFLIFKLFFVFGSFVISCWMLGMVMFVLGFGMGMGLGVIIGVGVGLGMGMGGE